jgi:sec-independent protein translocase protein TatC
MAFSYFLVFPIVFTFFIEISPTGVSMMTDINQYLDFVMKMFLAFGLAFEIPVATLLMVWSGLTTPDAMAAKRPYIIIGCFVLGMFLTPPDVVSQLLLAIPMWLLFEVGVVLARFVNKTQESETESSGTSD